MKPPNFAQGHIALPFRVAENNYGEFLPRMAVWFKTRLTFLIKLLNYIRKDSLGHLNGNS